MYVVYRSPRLPCKIAYFEKIKIFQIWTLNYYLSRIRIYIPKFYQNTPIINGRPRSRVPAHTSPVAGSCVPVCVCVSNRIIYVEFCIVIFFSIYILVCFNQNQKTISSFLRLEILNNFIFELSQFLDIMIKYTILLIL